MNKLIIEQRKIKNLVSNICRQTMLFNYKPDYVVGLTRGGLIPAVMLSHYFDVPMHTLTVSFRDNDIGPESNLWMAEDAYQGKKILIVDDINDTGQTLRWIKDDWESSSGFPTSEHWNDIWHHSVQFAVLIDNEASTFKGVDFYGMEINKAENDVWVDFPWEDWWTK